MSDPEKRAPVKYTVLEKSLVGNEIFEAGSTCEYDGLPAENLAPQCDEGRARYQEYLESNKARLAKQRAENPETAGFGDSAAFAAAIAKAIAESREGEDERVAKIVAAVLEAQKAPAADATAKPAKAGKAKAEPAADPLA